MNVSDDLRKTEDDIQRMELDLLKLRQSLKEKDCLLLKAKKDNISNFSQNSDFLNKKSTGHFDEKNNLNSKIKMLEKTVIDLKKDLKFYKELSE